MWKKKLLESFSYIVGWAEDGEGAWSRESVGQPSRFDERHEGGGAELLSQGGDVVGRGERVRVAVVAADVHGPPVETRSRGCGRDEREKNDGDHFREGGDKKLLTARRRQEIFFWQTTREDSWLSFRRRNLALLCCLEWWCFSHVTWTYVRAESCWSSNLRRVKRGRSRSHDGTITKLCNAWTVPRRQHVCQCADPSFLSRHFSTRCSPRSNKIVTALAKNVSPWTAVEEAERSLWLSVI